MGSDFECMPIVWPNELEAYKRYLRSKGIDESVIEEESKKCYVIELDPVKNRLIMTEG